MGRTYHHGNIQGAVLQETSGSASWARSLCEENIPTDHKSSHQALAFVPIGGRLMAALAILRNGTSLPAAAQLACAEQLLPLVVACFCKHVPVRGDGGPGLDTAVVHAMVVFMAACSSNRYDHCNMGTSYALVTLCHDAMSLSSLIWQGPHPPPSPCPLPPTVSVLRFWP